MRQFIITSQVIIRTTTNEDRRRRDDLISAVVVWGRTLLGILHVSKWLMTEFGEWWNWIRIWWEAM